MIIFLTGVQPPGCPIGGIHVIKKYICLRKTRVRQKEEGVFISDVIYDISKEEEEPTVQRLWMLSNTLYIYTAN